MLDSSHTPIIDFIGSNRHDSQLPQQVTWIPLQIVTPGRLNEWIAPAVRGLVLQPLRDRLCLLNEHEKAKRRSALKDPLQERYCRDCQKMIECGYGQNFEPDRLILSGKVVRGAREGLRSITFATFAPNKVAERLDKSTAGKLEMSVGESITLRILQTGAPATRLRGTVLEALNHWGQAKGLGPDHVRFRLQMDDVLDVPWPLDTNSLPLHLGNGSVPLLKIHLVTPLMLKRPTPKSNGNSTHRRSYAGAGDWTPDFSSIFRESLRTVRRAVGEYANDAWAHDTDWRTFFQAADQIETLDDQLQPFHQSRSSARQEKRWKTSGWQGAITALNVPVNMIPYLQWAGRLGIGDSRNCGAGLFHLSLG